MGTATTTNLVEAHYERSMIVCMVSAIALVTGASAAAKITQALDFLIDVAVAEIEAELEVDEVAGEV
jgi:hypothetical protein